MTSLESRSLRPGDSVRVCRHLGVPLSSLVSWVRAELERLVEEESALVREDIFTPRKGGGQ